MCHLRQSEGWPDGGAAVFPFECISGDLDILEQKVAKCVFLSEGFIDGKVPVVCKSNKGY